MSLGARCVSPTPLLMIPSARHSRFLAALVLALSLPLATEAQDSGGIFEGSPIGPGDDSGSGVIGEGSSTESGTDSGSGGGSGLTPTSYDAPQTYDLGGGTVALATAILNGGTVTNGTLNVSSTIDGRSGSVTAQLTGTAALLKHTGGTLTLAGSNTYTGATNIDAGSLLVTGSLGATSTTVSSGATLGGTGTIGGPTLIKSGGILEPGTSPGTLTFTDDLTFESGAILDFELGSASDLIVVSGGTLAGPSSGTLTFNLTAGAGFSANTYTLFTFAETTLLDFDLDDLAFGLTPSGWDYALDLTGNSLQLHVSAIPEPASIAFSIGGLALAVALLRRRRPAS